MKQWLSELGICAIKGDYKADLTLCHL